MGVAQAGLQGLQRVVVALLPDALLRPLLFAALIGLAVLLFGADWGAETALLLQFGATAAALAATAVLLRRALPREGTPVAAGHDARGWRRSGLVLAANSGLWMLGQRVDLILVGALMGAAAAGVYGVAFAAASLAGLAVSALLGPLTPIVASLHASGQHGRLARTVTAATRAALGLTLISAAALVLVSSAGLGLLGHAFTRGSGPLALLCLAAVVNAAFLANNLALVMTGHERAATAATAVGTAVAAAASAVLIPVWGLDGAAAAAVIAALVRNVLASWLSSARLGLDTTPLGLAPRLSPAAGTAAGSAAPRDHVASR
jgi:O-antigen/teichoic acid export membrane protein